MDKKMILSSFSLNENQKFSLLKVIDKAEISTKKCITRYTDFLDPYLAYLSEKILEKYYDIKYLVTGGYENSERKIFIFHSDYESIDYTHIPLKVINIENTSSSYGKGFSHREILGTILSLGLNREKIGDIIIMDNVAQIVVLEEVSSFIEMNLSRINRNRVNVSISTIDSIKQKVEDFKLINSTVKSLRVDSVAAAGFNETRGTVSNDIKRNKIKVNYKPVTSCSYKINEGDLISYRGKGRIVLEKLVGKTKKDRYKILIKKFT